MDFFESGPSRGELVGRNSRRKWGAEWSVWCSESAQPIVAQPPATTVSVSRNTGRDQRSAYCTKRDQEYKCILYRGWARQVASTLFSMHARRPVPSAVETRERSYS